MEAAALIHSTTPANAEKALREELTHLGLEWRVFKDYMPDWVDTAFDSRAGVLQLKTFLSRNVGLDIADNGQLIGCELPVARFKTTRGTTHDQVIAARCVATACARLVGKMTLSPWMGMPNDPAEFRRMVLAASENGWPDLSSMLTVLWSLGIPVLYMPSLPASGRKMEGMACFVSGRPVIVLTKKVPHPDWLLFLLGHEAGHIAEGHLPMAEGEAIVDDTVDYTDDENDGGDQQEREANRYSTRTLGEGGQEVHFKKLMRADLLAGVALTYARQKSMNPGYVVLNAVHNSPIDGKKPYGLGQAALKALPDFQHGRTTDEICKDALNAHVDPEFLRDDSLEFLEKLGVL
ncbi:hypothetical protein CYG48_13220 [Neorhizobium sp. SOG26]|uniref:hypothetical protein n=1 Tax=Neorhizobium sp. SOG26 TaxID=2060726 RepID=UPI000E9D7FA8|nr:hypothetical protein [Neorhizobium sp. SOG26]AXV16565.1 hypothetical protein CYG48_13220 [Neorhizobium sp. SOG26]